MAEFVGKFVWYDLMTSDAKTAEAFYSYVVGWQPTDAGMTATPYTLFSMGETMVCGLMGTPEDAQARGTQPHWIGHIGVDDVDAYVERVTAAGGAIHRAPQDIPGIGRYAVAADPQGAPFILFHPRGVAPDGPAEPFPPGQISWRELHSDDTPAELDFYASLFGWSAAEAVDLGEAGIYQMFSMRGVTSGAMMQRAPEASGAFWLFYINVAAMDAAVARVSERGGKIVTEPRQVPGGSWIANCLDPQGALFALAAPTR